MGKEILTQNQKTLLQEISRQKFIKNFYLTGGTALALFYLHHRYSEDLDFFTSQDIDIRSLTLAFESLRAPLGIRSIEFQESLNRNLFFFSFPDGEVIKTEFTFFPFERVEKGTRDEGLEVDSLLDIAVNKIFTVSQKPRARDFIDLFFIIRDHGYALKDLVMKAKLKFDWPIEPLNLGSQLMKVSEVADFPRMIKPLDKQELVDFFTREAVHIQNIFSE